MATSTNTVPLGQAGTGSAFVLPESQAANQLLKTLQYNRQLAQQQEQLKQQQAQQTAANWQKNQLKVDGGLYWQPEFNKRYQGHLEKGIQLRQMGIDPFNYNANDPNQTAIAQDYLLERQGILSDADARKSREANVVDQFKAYRTNPDEYEPESFQEVNDYINKPFSEVRDGELPMLRKRFNPAQEIIPKLDPITFQRSEVVGNKRIDENKVLEEPTKSNIETLFKSANGGERFLKRQTGLTTSEAKKISGSFDDQYKKELSIYNGDPKLREELAKRQILPNSPQLAEYLSGVANAKSQAKQKYDAVIDEYYGVAKAKANEFLKSNPDFTMEDQAMQRERLAIARRTEKRLAENAANGGGDDEAIYRQGEIDEMWAERNSSSGESNAVKRLKASVEANPLFQGSNVNTMFRDTGRWINVTIPERRVAYTTTNAEGEEVERYRKQDSYKVTIDKRNDQDKIKLNKVLDVLKGTKISEDKLQTGNAGGKVKGTIYTEKGKEKSNTTKTVPMSTIKSKVGKPGYEGYSQKELVEYYKSQGYIIK